MQRRNTRVKRDIKGVIWGRSSVTTHIHSAWKNGWLKFSGFPVLPIVSALSASLVVMVFTLPVMS